MVNLFRLPHMPVARSGDDPAMPRDGDAVLVLRSDGSTGMFTLGMDAGSLLKKAVGEGELDETEQAHVRVATRALALYLASINPDVMQTLIELSQDSDLIAPETWAAMPKIM